MLFCTLPKQNSQLISLSFQQIKRWPSLTSDLQRRFKTSYIVLLPEVPEDVAVNNPLLEDAELPNFEELTAEKCYTGVGKRSLDYETGVWGIEERIKDGSIPNTFSGVIEELDKLDAPLTYAWNTVKTMYSVRNDELSSSSYMKIHERARKARVHKFQSRPILHACKEIFVKEDLNEAQKRVVSKFLLESRLNGVELPPLENDALTATVQKLEKHKSFYRGKLQEVSKKFSYRIIDHEIIQDFPDTLLKRMAYSSEDCMKGPWTVTHHPLVYHSFLEHCPEKDLRLNAWRAYIMRCSTYLPKELSNSIHVEEIRDARAQQAKILGFKTFADMSMETKMAGTVDNVLNVIAALFDKAKEKQTEELKALEAFAQSRGFEGDLEEFDVPYWRRKSLIHTTKFKELQLEKYFPFTHVWDQLLSLCSSLFGVHFEEVPSEKVTTWHPSVRFFNVLDSDGTKIASFYLDPYSRPTEKLQSLNDSGWMLSLKTRSDVGNSLPVATLVFNFPNPLPEHENNSLLTLEDVQVLFKKFGHSLQHLLSTVPYGHASGLTNIEWDAVEVCSNFMLNWLYEPSVLEKISRHYETGESLGPAAIKGILWSRTHLAGFDLCSELFLSHFDLKLYMEDTFWIDILKDLWPTYMPFELTKYHALPCWFSPIISDVWASAYYSHVWAKMIAADAFGAFKECEPQEVTAVGRRFRETFLSLGGGAHPSEVFRQFRGRDPTPESLHAILGIS